MFSAKQSELIRRVKTFGFGYAIFATNVERQGFCSARQEGTLRKMEGTYAYRQNNWKPSTRAGRLPNQYKHNISDAEAMQSGDCF